VHLKARKKTKTQKKLFVMYIYFLHSPSHNTATCKYSVTLLQSKQFNIASQHLEICTSNLNSAVVIREFVKFGGKVN